MKIIKMMAVYEYKSKFLKGEYWVTEIRPEDKIETEDFSLVKIFQVEVEI